jgi:hypothetical protein
MCRTIGLPERTFHAAKTRPRCARSVSDERHKIEIRRVWTSNYSCYGPRRVYKKLRKEGYVIARCTVTRLMADIGLRGVQRGRKQFTTIPDDTTARPADLVERQFVAERPNQLWLADITYVSTWQGWLYVAFILDVHSRMIVGWQLANHLRTDLVLDALEMALWRRDLTYGDLIHHSDRGSQGELNRSSQHLDCGGVDGDDAGAAARGAALPGSDSITGPADGCVASGSCRVLGGDRARREDGRRRGRGGRVIPGWVQVVPSRWRREPLPAFNGVGSLPVLRRARGHRDLARAEARCARDRASAGSVAVDDLAGAAPQRIDSDVPSRVSSVARSVACRAAGASPEGREARRQRAAARLGAGPARR